MLSDSAAPGCNSLAAPSEPNAATSPTRPATRATTVVLASSAPVLRGTAWKVVRIVPNRYSVVTARVDITMTTISPSRYMPCVAPTETCSDLIARMDAKPTVSPRAPIMQNQGDLVENSLIRSTASRFIVPPPHWTGTRPSHRSTA